MKQKNTKELDDILGKTHISDFDKFCVEQKGSMDPEQNAFSEYIKDLLKEKKITQQMVFLKADIPEKYGYKLLSGEKHTRQRDIILRICYAAELTLEQTQRALRKYEMPQLYAKIQRDALLMLIFQDRPGGNHRSERITQQKRHGNAQDKWSAGVSLEYNFTTAAGRTVFIL